MSDMKGRNGRRLKPSRHRVRSEKRRDESADGRARVLIEQVEQFSSPRWGTGTNTHSSSLGVLSPRNQKPTPKGTGPSSRLTSAEPGDTV